MKRIVKGLVLSAALCLCAGYISNASRAGAPSQKKQEVKESEALSPEELARTKVLFEEKCSKCHGADGRGKTVTGEMLSAPDFTDEEWWKEGKSGKRLVTSVTEGRDGMPAFGKKLTQREINALAAYVRTFRKPE
ncbi:MAG: c-type cytochrome [Pyrinomonadaceae bacterium]